MNDNRIAMYIRLSNADEETGRKKDESDSIVNQRALINHFLDSSPELRNIPREEFVDDGYTGKNMDRPGFQNMIKRIKEGHFSICITKDFSRFSRDYIEMGDYLECLFPFLRVRYISINDNYDSNDYKGTTGGLDVAMRTFIYDSYSRDLSEKVKSGQKQSALKGRRVHGNPGYGYMMDPDNTAMDIIDPETSKVVRRIFELAISGIKPIEIARELSKDGIPSPGEYYRIKHPGSKRFVSSSGQRGWNSQAVAAILQRFTYTGASVQMKRAAVGPCQKKTYTRPKDEWIIVPGMHEAIVTEEEFEEAQKVINKKTKKPREKNTNDYSLKSVMVCGSCGRKLIRSTVSSKASPYFICQYRNEYGGEGCKEIRSPREDELHKIVYDAIIRMISLTKAQFKETAKVRKLMEKEEEAIDKCRKSIETFRRDILKEYEQYVLERISKKEFDSRKEKIERKIEKIGREIAEREAKVDREGEASESEMKANCDIFGSVKQLTNEMVRAFIEKIVVNPGNEIEIKWKFRDPFIQDA